MRNKFWQEMTNEERRIAIAELCGWIIDEGNPKYTFGPYWYKNGMSAGTPYDLPDYVHDLNAMHEAEKVLGDIDKTGNGPSRESSNWYTYRCCLDHICADKHPNKGPYYPIIHAAAEERAEAFYKTMSVYGKTSIVTEDEHDEYVKEMLDV